MIEWMSEGMVGGGLSSKKIADYHPLNGRFAWMNECGKLSLTFHAIRHSSTGSE